MLDKLSSEDQELIINLSKLDSENEIAEDIKKDFHNSGWRLIRKS